MNDGHIMPLALLYGSLATIAVFLGLIVFESLIVTFFSFHLLVCCGVPIAHGIMEGGLRQRWREGWRLWKLDGRGLLIGLGTGLLLMLIVMLGLGLLFRYVVEAGHVKAVLVDWGLTASWLWFFALYIMLFNSLLEELMWRGFLLERLERIISPMQAMGISSFFYAFYHAIIGIVLFGWLWGLVITLLVFGAGYLWAWIKRKYPTIYSTWVSHLLADAGIMWGLIRWVYGAGG